MFKARNQTWPCGSCVYWQPYPTWEGVGTCDNTMSRSYGRMAVEMGEPCECFVAATKMVPVSPRIARNVPEPKGPERRNTFCVSCQYWLPFDSIPYVGQCNNPESKYFQKPAFSDKPTEECFVTRSLDDLEFMWCGSHHQTIHSTELSEHKTCRVFVSSASLPVEDEMELTLAGD